MILLLAHSLSSWHSRDALRPCPVRRHQCFAQKHPSSFGFFPAQENVQYFLHSTGRTLRRQVAIPRVSKESCNSRESYRNVVMAFWTRHKVVSCCNDECRTFLDIINGKTLKNLLHIFKGVTQQNTTACHTRWTVHSVL